MLKNIKQQIFDINSYNKLTINYSNDGKIENELLEDPPKELMPIYQALNIS